MPIDISIVIPTFNRADFLRQAVASCFDGNDGLTVEVLVVDDGSSDAAASPFAHGARESVRLIRQDHQGPQVARNRGLAEAAGRYIKFLDDDDWLAGGALRSEFDLLTSQAADICSGDLIEADEKCEPLFSMPGARQPDLLPELLSGAVATNPLRFTMSIELARQESWDVQLPVKQDVDYFLRIATKSRLHARVPRNIGFVRRHGASRVSTRPGYDGALRQLAVIGKIIRELAARNALSSAERVAAARDILWQWAHICAVQDWQAATDAWDLIESLSAEPYLPRRNNALLRACDATAGPRLTELFLLLPRRCKKLMAAR